MLCSKQSKSSCGVLRGAALVLGNVGLLLKQKLSKYPTKNEASVRCGSFKLAPVCVIYSIVYTVTVAVVIALVNVLVFYLVSGAREPAIRISCVLFQVFFFFGL